MAPRIAPFSFFLFLLSIALLASTTARTVSAASCPGDLDDRADVASNPSGYDYDVYYTDDDPADSDWFPAGRAQWVRDAIANTHPILVGSPYDFSDPDFDGDDPQKTCIYDYNSSVYATAPADRIKVQSTTMNAQPEPWIRKVTGHEIFHHIQFASINFSEWTSWGTWFVEGTARYMEDKAFTDNDTTPANTAFFGAANNLLGNPNKTLTDLSYNAALWWSYLGEQLGSVATEPAYGVDFMQELLSQMVGRSPDTFGALRDAIAAKGSTRELETLWSEFQITLYTHDKSVSSLPDLSRFRFVDETPTGGNTPYDAVSLTSVASEDVQYSDSVQRWAGRHFEATFDPGQSCEVVGFVGEADSGKSLGWGLVTVDTSGATDKVEAIYQGRGNTFARAVVAEPSGSTFNKLALVVSAHSNSSGFTYSYGRGDPNGQVKLPSVTRPAKVGEIGSPPERFLVRTLVQGPPGLTPDGAGPASVMGLDTTGFDARLRSDATGNYYDDAEILTGRYVDGEYWLTLRAPAITNPADGTLYDLEICLCGNFTDGCGESMSSAKSVLYEDEVLHQALTLDRSYSMHYPEPVENAKITAAKNAARMYVDSANDDDELSVVTFTGNNSECDFDARTEPITGGLVPVSSNRANLRADIDAIVEDGWTSIGDGIQQAAGELSGSTSPEITRGIVLLSDGLENEADFWGESYPACGSPAVKDSFDPGLGGVNADVRIDTLAFGSDADQGLLQAIADFTNGLPLPVSALDPASSGGSDVPEGVSNSALLSGGVTDDPNPLELEVPNRLADAYRTIEEDQRGQDRLYFAGTELSAGTPVVFPVTVEEEQGGGVDDAVFAINWHLETPNVVVALRDPDGNLVSGASTDWTAVSGGTNQTYLHDAILSPGTWEVTIESDADVQATVSLSGAIVNGVSLNAELSQVRGKAPNGECVAENYRYLRGLPVKVIANVTDAFGGVPALSTIATVVNPDGSINKLTLFDDGAHDDELAGDGVYANAYTKTPFFSRGGVADFPAGPPTGAWGSYSVTVSASGASNFDESFRRYELRGFHVHEFDENFNACDPDDDDDGLPDRWEVLYGLDPTDPADATLDPDGDGLNSLEEFLEGTDPFDPDSDEGGESDGSEVAAGRDPLWEEDDLLPPVLDYGIITHTFHPEVNFPAVRQLLIHYPVHPNYTAMHVYRRDPGSLAFLLVDSIDLTVVKTGFHYDGPLLANQRYDYYLVAEGLSGALGAPTEIFSGVPLDDPIPPGVALNINNGYPRSGQRDVTLRFFASSDATEMRYSEDATFAGAPWMPFSETALLTLAPGGPGPYAATVFAEVRNAAGLVSIYGAASVVVDENGDEDGDGFVNRLDPDDDGDGVLDVDELNNWRSDPLGTDSDGDGLEDGTEVLSLGSDPIDPLDPPTAIVPVVGVLARGLLLLALVATAWLGAGIRR